MTKLTMQYQITIQEYPSLFCDLPGVLHPELTL